MIGRLADPTQQWRRRNVLASSRVVSRRYSTNSANMGKICMERAGRTEPARFLDLVSVLCCESKRYVKPAQAKVSKQSKQGVQA